MATEQMTAPEEILAPIVEEERSVTLLDTVLAAFPAELQVRARSDPTLVAAVRALTLRIQEDIPDGLTFVECVGLVPYVMQLIETLHGATSEEKHAVAMAVLEATVRALPMDEATRALALDVLPVVVNLVAAAAKGSFNVQTVHKCWQRCLRRPH